MKGLLVSSSPALAAVMFAIPLFAQTPSPPPVQTPTPVDYVCSINVEYSTYLGGASVDIAFGAAVDVQGCAYLAGTTQSSDFPIANAYQSSRIGSSDVAISKLSSSGSGLIYSSYLGGSEEDYAYGITVSGAEALVCGQSASADFPTVSPYQASMSGVADAFVVRISSSGSALRYSTYLGGSSSTGDYASALVLEDDSFSVCGYTPSVDFPTCDAYQASLGGTGDAFISRFSSSGSGLIFSTYLGGGLDDRAEALAGGDGPLCVMGLTESGTFPVVNAYQSTKNEQTDLFVSRFDSAGSSLEFSTFLGGNSNEYASGVAMVAGVCSLIGSTRSSDFPTLNPYQPTFGGGEYDAIVATFSSSGSALAFCSYFGGSSDDWGLGVAEADGLIYAAGNTVSGDFPTREAYQATCAGGGRDAFLALFARDDFSLLASTYLGGGGDDVPCRLAVESGSAYLCGYTASDDFPVRNAYQSSRNGGADIFLSKLSRVCHYTSPTPTAYVPTPSPSPSPSSTASPPGYQTPSPSPTVPPPTPLCYPLFVSGRVTDRLTGAPIGGGQAKAEVPDSSSEAGGSQADGTFAVTVPCTSIGTGTVTVTGRQRGYLPWQVDRSYADWDDVTGVEIALMPSYSEPGIESGDYDGDGTADAAVFRPGEGLWALRDISRIYYGVSSDDLVPGDYDGDGTAEAGVFRASGSLWAIRGLTRWNFGKFSDVAVPGDYDGDGTAEAAVFGQRGGLWAARGVTRTYYGQEDDQAVGGDYDGDGKREPAVFRGNGGYWAIRDLSRVYLGTAGDRLSPGDYAGEGKWRPAVFRASEGLWVAQGLTRLTFGMSGDRPSPADYDGDGVDDFGVFRGSSMLWAVKDLTRVFFGADGDNPVTR